MPRLTRSATATTLAAAVLLGAAAPAGAGWYLPDNNTALPPGGMEFTPGTWEEGTLQGPPERLEEDAQLGQVVEAAKDAQQAAGAAAVQATKQAVEAAAEGRAEEAQAAGEVALRAQAAGMEAQAKALRAVEQLGQAGPAPEAVSVLQTLPVEQVDLSLLEVTWDEMVGTDVPEGQENTAAVAAWKWLQIHGWRGDAEDRTEKLYAPTHPNYVNTERVGALEETWCFPILPGSDVTDHVADLLRAAGWQEADLWEPGGTPWLLPPEAFAN